MRDHDDSVGWRFLLSPRWLGYFALLLIFSIACAWFGSWQFERRAEARAEIERIDRNYDAESIPLADAVPDAAEFDEDRWKWQTVALRGEYVGESLLARNRPSSDGVGSALVQALRLDDGRVFFIDRGWVPVAGTDEIPTTLPAAPSGEVEVLARLRASESAIAGREADGRLVPSIEVPLLAELEGFDPTDVYAGVFGQLVAEQPEGDTGVLAERPERDEGPHLSYALQWFVFIIIAAIGVAYAARQEYRGLHADDDSVHGESVRREDRRRAERRRRKGPSDAEEEDALLGQ